LLESERAAMTAGTKAATTREPAELGQQKRTRGLWSDAFQRLRRNRGAMIGLGILVLLGIMAVFAPILAPDEPNAMTPVDALQSPSAQYPMGTDQFGRDILSRIIFGARLSLQVGFIAVGIASAIGITLGMIAGYYGRWIDGAIGIFIDIMLAFPGILLALAIVAVLGPNLINLMVAVGISSVPTYARLIRGAVLSARELTYVEAARVVGAGDGTIMFRHIMPNVIAPAIVLSTLGIGGAILIGAAISFLGLGAKPPTAEWGAMLSSGRNFLQQAWWITLFPGVAIMITVLSINLLGDGLRDALDPRLRN
jgi:peptide/nickel transport system permease protein